MNTQGREEHERVDTRDDEENLPTHIPLPIGLRREYVLEPVAVGTPLNEAPLQLTELLNVGEAAMSYKVDSHGIKRANSAQGHGMPVSSFMA